MGNPVVVIAGSGQVADILAYAWNLMHSGAPHHSSYSIKGLHSKIHHIFPRHHDASLLTRQALETVRVRDNVSETHRHHAHTTMAVAD